MKKRYRHYKDLLRFRRRCESLRSQARTLHKELSGIITEAVTTLQPKQKAEIGELISTFIGFINDYDMLLLDKTSMLTDPIRKRAWECNPENTDELYAIVDTIYRYMHSIQDGNVFFGFGKVEIALLSFSIVAIELYILMG